MSENKYPIGGYAPGEEKYIKAADVNDMMHIQPGHKIKIYGEERTVTGFYGQYNEGLEKWETIILTEGRGDPFERTIGDIEVLPDQPFSWQSKPSGAVWVKGDYDRLYDQLNEDVNCRIVCYVDYNTRSKNPDGSPYILRDICSIWGENMEFGSRGHGYGSVRFMPGDEKENFIGLCTEMNVEWLDESGTASNKDAIDFAEWILENNIEATLNDKGKLWVDFRLPRGKNKFTTTDLHKLWQQSKSK